MSETKLIHFDSCNACQYNYQFNDPFNAKFTLRSAIRNIKKIYLKTVEIPVTFTNIRNNSTLNSFSIKVSGVDYTITLPNTNYTSITQLCTDITTAFAAYSFPNSATFTLSLNNSGYCKASMLSPIITPVTFTINATQLSDQILGFKISTSGSSGFGTVTNFILASNVYNLNVDNYLTMYLSNINSSNDTSASGLLSTFKIPLNCVNGVVYFNSEYNGFTQWVNINDSSFILNNLNVIIYDRFGNQVLNNCDYSFTLAFEVDENNYY